MYQLGSVYVCWDKSFKDLTYTKQPVTQKEIDEWKAKGYNHENFTGNMYDSKNIMPDWVESIGNSFPHLKDKTYTIYRMDTLEIMPTHVDHFRRYCELFDVDRTDVRRALIFLEDWKPGHYFEVSGKGVVNWKAGDYCIWEPDADHAASNIGIEPRYTLQITGHV